MFVEILFIHFTKYAPAAAGSGWRLTVPGASHYKSRQVLSLLCSVLLCSAVFQLPAITHFTISSLECVSSAAKYPGAAARRGEGWEHQNRNMNTKMYQS